MGLLFAAFASHSDKLHYASGVHVCTRRARGSVGLALGFTVCVLECVCVGVFGQVI